MYHFKGYNPYISFSRFYQNPEMTFDQVNQSRSVARTVHNGNLSLGFAEGVMHDVFVSSIVGGGEHFIRYKPLVVQRNSARC